MRPKESRNTGMTLVYIWFIRKLVRLDVYGKSKKLCLKEEKNNLKKKMTCY